MLNNVESSSGALVATGTDEYAVSESKTVAVPNDLIDGLVSHYLLNNNSDDAYGVNDGINTDMSYNSTEASFNGSSSVINPEHQFLVAGGSFTVSLWVNISSYRVARLVTQYLSGTAGRGFIRLDVDGKVHTWFSGDSALTGINPIPLNEMVHIVVTLEPNSVKFYINSMLDSTHIENYSYANIGTLIGKGWGNSDEILDGDMSNLRFYDGVKDQLFINELYAEGYYLPDDYYPFGVDSSTGALVCIDTDGYAVSEPYDEVGCILRYEFENSVTDVVNSNDGTANGSIVYEDGKFGKSVRMNSSLNTYVTVPNVSNISSISIFFSLNNTAMHQYIIGNNKVDGTGTLVSWAGDSLRYYIRTSEYLDVGFDMLSPNIVYHVVITYDGTNYRSYFDGVLTNTVASSSAINMPDMFLGRHTSTAERCLLGTIDGYSLFDYVLSEEEIIKIRDYEKLSTPISIVAIKDIVGKFEFANINEPTSGANSD
ncbi:MAG: LamG domain-containing protein, partial [Caldisericia bacterium]|nr:LamG domain-containing protein [Caldisericia bacterium]